MSAHSLDSFTYSFDIGEVEGGLVPCFGGRGFVVFPEGADNHLCGIAVGLEDSFQVLALLRQSGTALIYSFIYLFINYYFIENLHYIINTSLIIPCLTAHI